MFSEKGTLLHIFKMHDNPNYPYLDTMTDNHDCVTHKYLLKKKTYHKQHFLFLNLDKDNPILAYVISSPYFYPLEINRFASLLKVSLLLITEG